MGNVEPIFGWNESQHRAGAKIAGLPLKRGLAPKPKRFLAQPLGNEQLDLMVFACNAATQSP